MDIFDSHYFLINKKFLIVLGLWPYDTQRKNFIRAFHLIAVITASIPQIISIRRNFSDWDRVMENLIYLLIAICGFLKIISLGMAQKKLRMMFDGILDNWHMITIEEERQILRKYSENGRRLTITWLLIFAATDFFFIFGPLIPVFLNKINPKAEWSYLYMLNGEYFIADKNSNYFVIYFWDVISTLIVSYIFVAADTTFFICIEHCLGLFAITRHRIRGLSQLVKDASADSSYHDGIVETIKLHQKTLQLTEHLEASYSTCFLFIFGYTVSALSLDCILIAVNLQSPVQVIRFGMVFLCVTVHLLNFCWPAQKLIDISTSLVRETYLKEWHTSPLKSKKALLFFMLRCSNACALTAWRLFIMNFENFLLIMKTAISFIMVLGSLRKIDII